ncbi:MAG: hypothetical protein LBB45_05250 [Methanobrevibacter sp.]|jgi:hypothetical protein|nr:hypothetical protein [Candidatus Methanovirga basalitermitum]
MKNKKGKKELSYNIQNTVDCDNGFILQSKVVVDPTDQYQFNEQLKILKERNIGDISESKILADSMYNTSESMKYIHENGYNAFIPNRTQATTAKNKKIKKFAKAIFHL